MAKDYELVGGQPVKVTPLEATEAGTYKAPHGQAFNPVKVGSTGGGLPPVTSDDNGDVLTVVEGEWAKAAPSGGGDILYVTLLWDNNAGADGGWALDKTYAEIREAIASKTPVCIWGEDYGYAVLEGVTSFLPTPAIRFSFFNVTSLGGNPVRYGLYVAWFALDHDDTLTLSEYTVQLTAN